MRDRRLRADRHAGGPGRRPRRAVRGPPRGRRDRGERPVAARGAHVPTGLLTTDPAAAGRRSVDRRGGGAHRRAGADRGAGPGRARRRQAGGHRQQGAPGLARGRGAAHAGQGEGGGPALRGGRGRGHPAGARPARVPHRRAHPPGHGHRQRDHQLHPDQDERAGLRLRRRAGRGPGARVWPSGTRPPTSRATTPRPRPPSWPGWPSGTTWPAPTSCARGSPVSGPSTSSSPTGSGTRSSCWPSWSGPATMRCRCGSIRPWCRRPIRWPGSATRSTPCSSRGRRPASSCSTGWGPGACPRPVRWSATSSTPPATCWPARPPRRLTGRPARLLPESELRTQYYVSLDVTDRPGCSPR